MHKKLPGFLIIDHIEIQSKLILTIFSVAVYSVLLFLLLMGFWQQQILVLSEKVML